MPAKQVETERYLGTAEWPVWLNWWTLDSGRDPGKKQKKTKKMTLLSETLASTYTHITHVHPHIQTHTHTNTRTPTHTHK